MGKFISASKNAFLYVKDFCEDTVENIRETAMTFMDSAKLQYRIISQRNELNAMYAWLGKNLIREVDGGEGGDPADINSLCERIRSKEEILLGLERQLRIVAGKIICSGCGKFMSDKYAYCPYCGRRNGDDIVSEEESLLADISEEELDDVRQLDDI